MGEVRAKKALGQHFLVDLNIARKICDSLSGGSAAGGPCTVLEVGCGMGVLTQFLLRRSDIVTWGAEIDPESVAYLHAHYPEFAPRLVAGDFLGMNLRERFPEGLKIIGNFPYNISSQIFFKVLENRDLVPECVGMIQKEVAVRLAEPPGSKEYGILSVLLQAWYDIEYLFTVNETVFNPPPKVKSAVIRLRRNATERLGCDETLFVKVVKASFGQRRKMIRNSLKSVFGDFGGAEHPFFTRRAEQLGVALFEKLGLPAKKKTKSGYSTGAEVLEGLKNEHPAVSLLLNYRQLAKLKSTYADGLMKDEEIYNIFNTTDILGRPPIVVVDAHSGAAGIAAWINTYYMLDDENKVEKQNPGIAKIKEWIDAEYAEGRTTVIGDAEMEQQVKRHLPRLLTIRESRSE